jgi:hypothetical protein
VHVGAHPARGLRALDQRRRGGRGRGPRLHDRVLVGGWDLAVGALVAGLLLRSGAPQVATGAEPALVH